MEFEAIQGVRLVTTRNFLKLASGISSVHSNISLGSHGYMKSSRRKKLAFLSVCFLVRTYVRHSVKLALDFSLHLS